MLKRKDGSKKPRCLKFLLLQNPFNYSAGQLRLHGSRVGTYDMQKSRTLGVKRDVLATDGECYFTYSRYVDPAFFQSTLRVFVLSIIFFSLFL